MQLQEAMAEQRRGRFPSRHGGTPVVTGFNTCRRIHEDWMIWGLLSESETCETSIFQEAYEHRHSQDGVRVHGQAVIQQLLPDGHPGKT